MNLDWPLMKNNITREDRKAVIEFLKRDERLTQSDNVLGFEREWSRWLGAGYSVFVNSGASANLLTLAALKHMHGTGEIVVPALTWVSDIAGVLHCGLKPVFTDIELKNLGMKSSMALERVTKDTRAVFPTYVLGMNCLDEKLLSGLKRTGIPLLEDACESHGASYLGRKLGTYGIMSNFSFYYAHHLSTIEGGMVCTSDEDIYRTLRMLRSHGLVREAASEKVAGHYALRYPDLNPEFIFALPGYNMRSTEINAVIGRNQLRRIDENNRARCKNFRIFIKNLDPERYYTGFETEGSVNYALILILREQDDRLMTSVVQTLQNAGVEYRRGTSGGGNQLRQPYLEGFVAEDEYKNYPVAEHVHFYGMYIGNYPELEEEKILALCSMLNKAG